MRANEFIVEKYSRGRPVVMVDIQPAYTPVETHYEYLEDVVHFLVKQRAPVLAYVNADETGLTYDNIGDDIIPMWNNLFMDAGYNRDQLIAAMEDVQWVDKGYGYLRGWMDSGVPAKHIIATIRAMYNQKVYDSRDLFGGDEEKRLEFLTPIADSINSEPETLIDDALSVGWVAVDQLRKYNNCYIIGGAREQCLAEVQLLMNAFNIRYTVIDSLVYD
jgi:hypothetical protein